MKNAQSILTNYITPDGNAFKFEEGEKIIVDSFSFISAMNKVTYIAFLTSQRFIFKQSKYFSANGMGAQEGLTADCSFLWLNDLKGIKISKGRVVFDGKVIDFSNDKETENWQYGTYGKGTFGGLSYQSNDEVYSRLAEALVELSQSYDFHIWAPNRPEITSSTKEQQKRLNDIRSRQLKVALGITGAIVGCLTIWGIATGGKFAKDPEPAVSPYGEGKESSTSSANSQTDTCYRARDEAQPDYVKCEVRFFNGSISSIKDLSNGYNFRIGENGWLPVSGRNCIRNIESGSTLCLSN